MFSDDPKRGMEWVQKANTKSYFVGPFARFDCRIKKIANCLSFVPVDVSGSVSVRFLQLNLSCPSSWGHDFFRLATLIAWAGIILLLLLAG